jgi:hypothetical protein
MNAHAPNDRETEGDIMQQLAHIRPIPAMQVHE